MGVALLLALGATYVQTKRLDLEQRRHQALAEAYADFRRQVREAGEQAEKAKALKESQDRRNKERSDAEIKRLSATNKSLSDGLLNARTASGYVPRASSGAGDTDLACFSRTELNAAIGRLDAGISGLALQGDQAITGLDSLRTWAQSR